ncbi:MAG: S-layer homology domain-containing protein [Bryobacterales bacterium]|nr:S-layer homology domain-containing protein [Bryobacterales bacterium]
MRALVFFLLTPALMAQPARPVVGDTRPLPDHLLRQALWDGSKWSLEVRSPGAAALRLHFTGFHVGGGLLRITGTGSAAGPFTQDGPLSDGDFWSPLIAGDTAIVEYEPSPGASGEIPFRIPQVGHFYPAPLRKDRERGLVACHADLTTQPAWLAAASSVALMLFETTYMGIPYWTVCTGTLLADTNHTGRPLFLTAHHCIQTDEEARSLETYWNFRNTGPSTLDYYSGNFGSWIPASLASTLQKVTGATILKTTSESEGDGTLLLLAANPPPGVMFAAWNPRELPLAAPTGTVHHPDGSFQRITLGQRAANDPGTNVEARFRPSDYYYKISEQVGLTEGGSSGAALLTNDFLVSGTLSYGPEVSCADPNHIGIYGRFTHFLPRIQSLLNFASPGPCMAEITAVNQPIPAAGGGGTFNISAPPGCYWAVASDYNHISVAPNAGSGPRNGVTFTVSPNSGTFPTSARPGTFSVISEERRVVHLMQEGTGGNIVFADVPLTHPFAPEINFLKGYNVQAYGCALPSGFCPESATTRGQMAEFIIRTLYGDNFIAAGSPYFADVATTHPAFRFIQKMKELDITGGCTLTTYCPDDPVTRGQMAAFLIRALQVRNGLDSRAPFSIMQAPYFTDTSPSNIFFSYIQEMKELGITSGCTATAYCVNDSTTRGQIAVFLVRALFALSENR